jgi:hypothetical protein
MVKSGSNVIRHRLPPHLRTTLSSRKCVPNYVIYSDKSETINGFKTVDVFANVSSTIRETEDFQQFYVKHKKREPKAERHTKTSKHDRVMHDNQKLQNGAWRLDRFKFVPAFIHAVNNWPDMKWYIFMEADSYLFLDNVFQYLSTLNSSESLYIGSATLSTKFEGAAFAHGGAGFVVSQGAIKRTFKKYPTNIETISGEIANKICCGDQLIGEIMAQLGQTKIFRQNQEVVETQRLIKEMDEEKKIDLEHLTGKQNLQHQLQKPIHGSDILPWGVRFQTETPEHALYGPHSWCTELLSFHHLKPHDILRLARWDALHRERQQHEGRTNYTVRFKDAFETFVAPNLPPSGVRRGWDNMGDEITIRLDDLRYLRKRSIFDGSSGPPSSISQSEIGRLCYEFCNRRETCLQYRFEGDTCWTSDRVKLGSIMKRKEDKDTKDQENIAASGWMMKRIEKLAQTKC